MKTVTAIICLLALAISQAQCQSAPTMRVSAPMRVTLELKDTPLKWAIEQVIQFGTAKYKIDPALDKLPYDRIFVSVKLENVPFTDALTSLLQTHGLAVKIEDGVGVICPVATRFSSGNPNGMAPMVAATLGPPPDLVTMVVPRMQIGEALGFLYRDAPKQVSFAFQGKLAMAIMPGATFCQFPRDDAADVLLAAAGLVPPTGNDKLIKSVGPVNLSTVIRYMPFNVRAIPYGLPRGYASGYPTAVAVAAFKTGNLPNLLLVVLANQEQDAIVLDSVLGASGMGYVLGDMGQQPNPQAPTGPRLLSIRLYGVTLEQALNSILPSMNLRYRMQGPALVIEVKPPR